MAAVQPFLQQRERPKYFAPDFELTHGSENWKSCNSNISVVHRSRLVISDARQNEHPIAWAPTSDWLSAPQRARQMLDAATRAFMNSLRRARWNPTSTAARVRSL